MVVMHSLTLRGLPRLGVNALTTYELRVSQPLPDNPAKRLNKSTSVSVFPLVKPKRLFIQIPEQMKRFNIHIRPSQGTLEKRPEVFESVDVNMSLRVALRMVNHVVNVFIRELVILEGNLSV